jgi:hypothetical protein
MGEDRIWKAIFYLVYRAEERRKMYDVVERVQEQS